MTDADWKAWRKAKRAELLAAREGVAPETRRKLNAGITERLVEGFPQLAGMTIGFYWPHRGEFDPRVAVLHWRRLGSRTALPVVLQKAHPLEFRLWWPGAPESPGAFGLPAPQTEAVVPQALLIPPVGFDEQGYRLGYGGAYFDRTLAAMDPKPLRIGVGFEMSRLETIFPQPHDIPMEYVVTETGIHRVEAGRLCRLR